MINVYFSSLPPKLATLFLLCSSLSTHALLLDSAPINLVGKSNTINQRLQALKDTAIAEKRWIKKEKRKSNDNSSRMAITTTLLCLTAGLAPLVLNNASHYRFLGPLANLMAQPAIKYGLLAAGWLGSVRLAHLLFPSPSKKVLEDHLNRYANFVEPMVKQISDIEAHIKQQDEFIESQVQHNNYIHSTLKIHHDVIAQVQEKNTLLGRELTHIQSQPLSPSSAEIQTEVRLSISQDSSYHVMSEKMQKILREISMIWQKLPQQQPQ